MEQKVISSTYIMAEITYKYVYVMHIYIYE